MYYDDHEYCETCRLHSRACWCWTGRPEIDDPDEDIDCPGGPGHDQPWC